MIYLDNAATTRMSPEVLNAIIPYLKEEYGNAGTIYGLGRRAHNAIEVSRAKVAKLFGAPAENIVFTSGGSEANSMVFDGVMDYLLKNGKKHIIISSVEHDSVIKAAENMCMKSRFDIKTQYIGVNDKCVVNVEDLSQMLSDDVGLVSVMYVNNETGAVNPVSKIGEMCRDKGILFHTDCVQAAGCHPIDVETMMCDFASVSSHKIHGGKGVGALYIRDKSILTPLISGGTTQEYGLRGGTENVPGIIGFGIACEQASDNLAQIRTSLSFMKRLFYQTLIEELKKVGKEDIVKVNGASVSDYGKTLNLTFRNVDAETLVLLLDSNGVCVSAGSACRSHESEPSHVLIAMGLTPEEARDSIRVSFSTMNSLDDAKFAANKIAECIDMLVP